MVSMAQYVAGATRQPLPFGLFSVLSFREGEDSHWQFGVEFEALNCGDVGGISGPSCAVGFTSVGLPRSLETSATQTGDANSFGVYGHHQCSPIGLSFEEAAALARERLLVGEERRVEQAFWTGDLGNTPSLQDASTTALASGAAQQLPVGLGLLEEYIGDNYGSLGVIHMSRKAATYCHDFLEVRGKTLTTKLGTLVVAGAGYPGTGPTGQAAAGATQWVYATPALFGHRSDIYDASNRAGDLLDRGVNNFHALAERAYLLGFDPCGVAAVLIDPTL